jgi:hypothetical protein
MPCKFSIGRSLPTYHALDTTVKLCICDPQQERSSIPSEAIGDGSFELGSSFSSQYPAQLQSSPPKKKEKFRSFHSAKDQALGYTADVLKEEYFDGHEGVDFLGDDMPFFLVNAGKDLFFEPRQPATEHNSVHEEQTKATSKPSGDSDQSDLAALPSLQHPSGMMRPLSLTTKTKPRPPIPILQHNMPVGSH